MELNLEDLTALSKAELDTIYDAVRTEIDRRLATASLQQEAENLANRYERVAQGRPAREWQPGMVVGPGDRVIENGIEYTNTSRAWLSVPPSQFILGYHRSNPTPVTQIPLWVPGETITQAMMNEGPVLRALDDVVYQCVQPHTTQAGWAPNLPGMTALWVTADLASVIANKGGRKR